jgi:hypothetical protein
MHDDDEDPVDPLPQLRAEMDQMIAIMPEIARTGFNWYRAFMGEGFSDTQALYLTACELIQHPGKAP